MKRKCGLCHKKISKLLISLRIVIRVTRIVLDTQEFIKKKSENVGRASFEAKCVKT